MSYNPVYVTKTYLPSKEKYKSYIDKIFNSGWLTNDGQLVKELENRLKDYLNVKNIVIVSNGTLALQLAYKLLNLNGNVITTPFSFVATTSSIVWEGLTPIFTDIDKNSFNIDWRKIEKNITSKTSAIVPVHVFGNICNIEKIQEIANAYKLKIIYDAAHAFGNTYKEKGIGNYGDIVTFSFHSTKIFHTIEGGALVINDDKLYEKAKLMRNFGIPGYDRISELGINCKMNEFQAAMGLCVLNDLPEIIIKRKKVYNKYLQGLMNNKKIQFQKMNNYGSKNFSYFPIILESEKVLLKVISELNKENIFPRRYFYPSLETVPYLKKKQSVPVSHNISKRILCLPLYEDLEENIQEQIISIVGNNS